MDTFDEQVQSSGAPAPKRRLSGEETWDILSAPSHIYFIYSAGRIKIGYSANWGARVETVCQGCSHHAELILVMPGDREAERGFHALFEAYRDKGEWFLCEGKLREFLQRFSSPEGQETLKLAEEAFEECSA